ncbi:LLM class flavin-dependent oxidoreductase [Actinoplanes sp. NPDC049265]|uniref:LLM class flavin-dependent oxidoreductase n=1 Tax=Actinoplanes sp. NPDC049265 TaxID=3363902 RepID=UPI0037186FE7
MPVPLSILDLAPLVSGGTAGDALRRTIDLAQRAEEFGYARYWVAEHHFTAGVASSQPALLLGQIAAHTSRIRLGSGAVQTGHQTPLTIIEQFGLLDALYPRRFDLGLGRSGQRRSSSPPSGQGLASGSPLSSSGPSSGSSLSSGAPASSSLASGAPASSSLASGPSAGSSLASGPSAGSSLASGPSAGSSLSSGPSAGSSLSSGPSAGSSLSSGPSAGSSLSPSGPPPADSRPARVVDGLLIPAPFSFAPLLASSRYALFARLLQQPGAESPDLPKVLDDIQALLAGAVTDDEGNEAHAVPGEGADLEIWILGSSGGLSAQVAGERGLPFAANYHVAPAAVLEAVEAYRSAFKPSRTLAEPRVMVSADVVVADDDETARRLAEPYRHWVRSIRSGQGAIPFPSTDEARALPWTDEDQELVADRLATQFVGAPHTVAERLRTLQRVTGADELLVTTITHDHTDRVRSFQLLAKEWHQ